MHLKIQMIIHLILTIPSKKESKKLQTKQTGKKYEKNQEKPNLQKPKIMDLT